MPPEMYAALAALSYAASNICIRLGVRTASVVAGLLISLFVGTVMMLGVLFVDLPQAISFPGVLLFAVSGLLGPGLGRTAAMTGIERLGPALSIPLLSSLYPVFAVAGASVTLREDVGFQRWLGLMVVVLGVWILSMKEAAITVLNGNAAKQAAAPSNLGRIPAIAFPLMAGIFYGGSDVFRKAGVDVLPHAVLGALIGTASALTVWTLLALTSGRIKAQLRFGKGAWWMALSGAFSAAAFISVTRAFEQGDVAVVTPIVAAQPLPVLLLSAIFLRSIDQIDVRIVIGTIGVVGGTLIVSTA